MKTIGRSGNFADLRAKVEQRNLVHLGLIILFGILATTLPQTQAQAAESSGYAKATPDHSAAF
jgi:hypothetical protein